MPVLLHQRPNPDSKHEENDNNSPAANNQRQKHRACRPAYIGFVTATDPDAIGDQSPNQRDRPTATWNNAKQRRRPVGETERAKSCFKGLIRAAEHHETDMHQRRPNE